MKQNSVGVIKYVKGFGGSVRHARLQKAWSQDQLASRIGCCKKTVSRVETTDGCSKENEKRLIEVLELDEARIRAAREQAEPREGEDRVVQIEDGHECFKRLWEWNRRRTEILVVRDPAKDEVASAIAELCDVIDVLRRDRPPSAKDNFRAAMSLGQVSKVLRKSSWHAELQLRRINVWGTGTHDREYYYTVCVSPKSERLIVPLHDPRGDLFVSRFCGTKVALSMETDVPNCTKVNST